MIVWLRSASEVGPSGRGFGGLRVEVSPCRVEESKVSRRGF